MKVSTLISGALARGYTTKENEQKVLDPVLIEAMTNEVMKALDERFWIKKKRGKV